MKLNALPQWIKMMCWALMPVGVMAMASVVSAKAATGPKPAVQIDHLPVTFGEKGKSILIEASLQSPGRALIYLRIYYRHANESSFRFVEMRPATRGYVGEIPGRHVQPPSMQYFLIALLSDQTIMSLPSRNPYGQPFEILINAPAEKRQPARPKRGRSRLPESEAGPGKGTTTPTPQDSTKAPESITPQLLEKLRQLEAPVADENADSVVAQNTLATAAQPSILVLSPEPSGTVPPNETLIVASFDAGARIDTATVKILLDGRNLTSRAEITPHLISLDAGALKGGTHRVTITADDSSGASLEPASWQFRVSATTEPDDKELERPPAATGVAFVDAHHEKFGGSSLDNNSLGGNLSGSYGALSYHANAYLTSLEDPNFQPRNRFMLSAGTSWLNVTLGDATPYFNDLVLWGRRVRGVQAQLHAGLFNLDFITGETIREISPIPGVRNGTFRQSLLAIRPSFGGRKRQIGFTLMRARDDTTSISANAAGVTPRSNLVIGADFLTSFDRNRIEVKGAVAQAFVTTNTRLPLLSKALVDSIYGTNLPFDPAGLRDWLVVNESLAPIDPRGGAALAYQLSLRFNYFRHFLTVGYKSIGAEYLSFGHSFLRNDLRGFFINDRWSMFQSRVFLNLGVERYQDHFKSVDGNPTIDLNTVQVGVTVNWAPEWPALNFNLRHQNRDNGIDTLAIAMLSGTTSGTIIDTTDFRQDERTRDFSFNLSQEVQAFNLAHTVSLGVTGSNRVDRWASQRVNNLNVGEVVTSLQSITVRTKFRLPLFTTLSFATNRNNVGGQPQPFKYNALNAQADYAFPRPQIRAHAGMRFVDASGKYSASGAGTTTILDYNQIGFNVGGSVMLARRHDIAFDLGLIKFRDRGGIQTATGFTPNSSFTNGVIRAHYEYRF